MHRLAIAVIVLVTAWVLFNVWPDPNVGTEISTRKLVEEGTEAREAKQELAEPAVAERSETKPQPADARDSSNEQLAPVITERRDERARIRGRALFPGGVAAGGVLLEFSGRIASERRAARFGLPEDWSNLNAKSERDGTFEIFVDPPPAFQFSLRASAEGFGTENWGWGKIAPNQVIELGDVLLRETGEVVVQVLDANSQIMRGAWRITASTQSKLLGKWREATHISAKIDLATGFATIENIPAGATKLSAFMSSVGHIDGPTVEVIPGEVTRAKIHYDDSDQAKRITVGVGSAMPIHTLSVEGARAYLIGLDAERIEMRTESEDEFGSQFVSDELALGEYTIEILHDDFDPWSKSGVAPGARIFASLVAGAAIQLSVLGPSSEEMITNYELDFHWVGSRSWPDTFNLKKKSEAPPVDGVFRGLPPDIRCELIVTAPGFPSAELPIAGLTHGEIRPVKIRLRRGARIVGRVVLSDGSTPMAHVQVQLARGDHPPVSLAHLEWSGRHESRGLRFTETDANGAFAFADATVGTARVHAVVNDWLTASSESLDLTYGETQEDIELALPPFARLSGRLTIPSSASLHDLRLTLAPRDSIAVHGFTSDETLPIALDSDGRFRADRLPPGPAVLRLDPQSSRIPGVLHFGLVRRLPVIVVGTIDLAANTENRFEAELGDRWPGSLRVEATIDGRRAADFLVSVRGTGRERNYRSDGVLDSNGECWIRHLPAGEWSVELMPLGKEWVAVGSKFVTIQLARESHARIEARLAEGLLLVRNRATTEALAETNVWLRRGANWTHQVRTNAAGEVSLTLTPGDYEIGTGGRAGDFSASFEWTLTGARESQVLVEVVESK